MIKRQETNINQQILILIFIIILISPHLNLAQKYQRRALPKTNGLPVYAKFNINNISTWIKNNGQQDINPNGSSGVTYPISENKQLIFQSGILWGGIHNGGIKVGGSTYRQGLLPGKVLENGEREDETQDHVRIYRVRPDWQSADLSKEIFDEKKSESEIRDAYEKDWKEWPAEYGAPYTDINKNGKFESDVDIAGIPGAEQTIWYVANDLDTAQAKFLYGSDPIGLELQVTHWGYSNSKWSNNIVFRRYRLINKSSSNIDSMYFGFWADPDVGGAGDDFTGCDTLLNLAYAYNGENSDAQYGDFPPAVGYKVLQGPIANGTAADSAIFDGKLIYGKRNLPMTAHHSFHKSHPVWHHASFGYYKEGTLTTYNCLQGLSADGTPYSDHYSFANNHFMHAGDPLTGEGWVDGSIYSPGDRSHIVGTGPFELASTDTQEVVFALIAAGYSSKTTNLGAVGELKKAARLLQLQKKMYLLGNEIKSQATEFTLSPQNNSVLINFEESSVLEKK